jgi:hypothetical protein
MPSHTSQTPPRPNTFKALVGRVITRAKVATLRRGAWAIKRALLLTGQGLVNLANSSVLTICEATDSAEATGSAGGSLNVGEILRQASRDLERAIQERKRSIKDRIMSEKALKETRMLFETLKNVLHIH